MTRKVDSGSIDVLPPPPESASLTRRHRLLLLSCLVSCLGPIGSYLKYGLFDADVLLDVTATSINRLWTQLAPAIERMRVTRGESLYENFEYWAAKGRLWAKANPGGAYPKKMPRMRDLKGVGTGAGTAYRPAIFGDLDD